MSNVRGPGRITWLLVGLGLAPLAACVPPPAAVPPVRSGDAAWTSPVVPATCTATAIATGDIVGCVLPYTAASAQGFGAPPFPVASTQEAPPDVAAGALTPPPGWTWNGWGYNGSAALTAWEGGFTRNTTAIGSVRAGTLTAPPDVLPLYEGFLRDLVNGGYTVKEYGSYGFRCTSNSASRDCLGLTSDSLSLHAYGLALDINWTANPERIYRNSGEISACAVPMATDLPAWAVSAAQRWGLFWGGYGWSGRCPSPAAWSTYVNRDATHLEFRGSPDLARRIVAWNAGHPVPAAAQPLR